MKRKAVSILLLTFILLAIVSTNVFATNTNTERNIINNINNIATINNVTTNNTNRTNTVVNTTSLPKTGVDYSLFVVIGLFACSAVYAYAKIRKYKV